MGTDHTFSSCAAPSRIVGALLFLAGTAAASAADAQEASAGFSNGDAALHAKVLKQRIDQLVGVQSVAEVLGVLDVAVGTTSIALAAPHMKDEPQFVLTYAVGFGLSDVAAASSLFMTLDMRTRVFQVIIPATPAVASLGLALAHDPYPLPKLSTGSLAAGYFASALLEGINDFSIPTPFSTLRAHQQRLENEQDLSAVERRAMHRDVLGARGPLPRWAIGAPLLVAGAVAMSPAFSDRYASKEKTWAGALGGLSLLSGLFSLFPSAVSRYESDLETLHISVALLPGALSVRGAFTAL